jgi:hypothetical protein
MSNLHPIFDEITQRALGMAHVSLGVTRCTAVGQATQTHNVLCQLPTHDESTYHWAYVPGVGDVEWRDTPRIGRFPEVESGVCDPDDEHDQAKESREDPL